MLLLSERQASLTKAAQGREAFVQLLRSCTGAKHLAEGRHVHARIVAGGHEQDRYLANLLVQMYGKCGGVEDARKVFDGMQQKNMFSWSIMMGIYVQKRLNGDAKSIFDLMPEKDLVSWNTMVGAYAQSGHLVDARSFFDHMPQHNVVSWTALVAAYAQNGHLEEAKSIFDGMPERNVVSWTALVAAYAQEARLEEARSIFETMPQTDIVSWNAIVAGYAQHGHLEEARSIFHQMPEQNNVSSTAMLIAYAQNGQLEEARSMFSRMPREPDVVSWTAMVAAFAQCGQLKEAKQMFDRMPVKNVISWNSMLAAYAHNGQFEEAKNFLSIMAEKDVVSWNTMVAACALNGYLSEAKAAFDRMPERDVISWNSMAAAYAQNGHLEMAKNAFDAMLERNAVSWNAMLAAYAHNGHGKEALELLQSMSMEGMKPNEITFMSVLVACSHLGMVRRGWRHFISMISDYGVKPMRDHYCCMLDLLGRAGQLNDAEDLINSMPFLPDAVEWGTLLGACKIYRDVERAARLAKPLFETNPQDDGPYVLLANIYALAGRKEDVAMVRKMMKDRGLAKQPGMSSIEVQNTVHRFTSGDASHPRTEDIRMELQRLNKLMEEAGYVADTREVLHDVSEEERKSVVCHHSERLAIALGLISTEAGTPIRVLKTLRVCNDCHTATKFISTIVGRQIVVRDSTRFHRFENGICSCRDYW